MTTTIPVFEEVTPAQWQRLAEERVFFGHQSVGGNLMQGVQEVLEANPSIPLRAVEIANAAEITTAGLYHAAVGRNEDPASKLAAFREIVNQAVGDTGTAMLKFCYIDVNPNTDPKALFEAYQREVDGLRQRHPGLSIVHFTLPLQTDPGTLRHLAAAVRGLKTTRDLNLIRREYNDLVRVTYGGKDPIFDLAQMESTRPDGQPAVVGHKGAQVQVLAPDWTYDGGHLNEAGRQHMAKAFLATLAMAQDAGLSTP